MVNIHNHLFLSFLSCFPIDFNCNKVITWFASLVFDAYHSVEKTLNTLILDCNIACLDDVKYCLGHRSTSYVQRVRLSLWSHLIQPWMTGASQDWGGQGTICGQQRQAVTAHRSHWWVASIHRSQQWQPVSGGYVPSLQFAYGSSLQMWAFSSQIDPVQVRDQH